MMSRFLITLSLCTLLMLIPVNAQVFDSPDSLTVVSRDLNVTFDKAHGGVISSLKFYGTEYLAGDGPWGTIDLVRSYYTTGDICTLWPAQMLYQYNDGYTNVSYEETDSYYIVHVHSITGDIKWLIGKDHNIMKAEVDPSSLSDTFLYVPLKLQDSYLTFYTLDGPMYAGPTEYCVAPYYDAPLVEYSRGGQNLMLFSQNPMAVSYYGYDTSSWQLHYPIPNPKDILFIFWMLPQ